MMKFWKHRVFHNWHLKIFSLVLATTLWAAVANEANSEIGVSVPLEYQNIPPQMEVIGDGTNEIEVRLRGPSSFLKELSTQDVSVSVDMANIPAGQEKILPLTAQQVKAPFDIEVVRVIPARVRVTVEPTIIKPVPLVAPITGTPKAGFEVEKILITPPVVEVEGPESHLRTIHTLSTTGVDVAGRHATFFEMADLDIPDPVVRVPRVPSVQIEVRMRESR